MYSSFEHLKQDIIVKFDLEADVKYKPVTAFTLIELLIVVAIIGILAAIAVPNFLNAQIKARISQAYADTRTLADAIEMYRLDNNSPPPVKSPSFPAGSWIEPMNLRFLPLTTPIAFLSTVPKDPFGWPECPPKDNSRFPACGNSYDYWWYKDKAWVIQSLGPARIHFETTRTPPYDASNGIKSLGYISRFSHGSVGGWQTPEGDTAGGLL